MAEVAELQRMKLAELRQSCESRGLDAKGSKAELVVRLQALHREETGGPDHHQVSLEETGGPDHHQVSLEETGTQEDHREQTEQQEATGPQETVVEPQAHQVSLEETGTTRDHHWEENGPQETVGPRDHQVSLEETEPQARREETEPQARREETTGPQETREDQDLRAEDHPVVLEHGGGDVVDEGVLAEKMDEEEEEEEDFSAKKGAVGGRAAAAADTAADTHDDVDMTDEKDSVWSDKKRVVRISAPGSTTTTFSGDRLLQRAKRFNMTPTAQSLKAVRATRFGFNNDGGADDRVHAQSSPSSSPAPPPRGAVVFANNNNNNGAYGSEAMDVVDQLKKRAERFGGGAAVPAATVLQSKADDGDERLRKRKARFADGGDQSAEAKRRKRVERFGQV